MFSPEEDRPESGKLLEKERRKLPFCLTLAGRPGKYMAGEGMRQGFTSLLQVLSGQGDFSLDVLGLRFRERGFPDRGPFPRRGIAPFWC